VPDLVLEVVTMQKYDKDYSLYSQTTRNQIEYVENLVEKHVRVFAKDVAREVTNEIAME
jgi:hypothetical protein